MVNEEKKENSKEKNVLYLEEEEEETKNEMRHVMASATAGRLRSRSGRCRGSWSTEIRRSWLVSLAIQFDSSLLLLLLLLLLLFWPVSLSR